MGLSDKQSKFYPQFIPAMNRSFKNSFSVMKFPIQTPTKFPENQFFALYYIKLLSHYIFSCNYCNFFQNYVTC